MGDDRRKRSGCSTGSFVLTPPTGVPAVGEHADPPLERPSTVEPPPAHEAAAVAPALSARTGGVVSATSCVCGHDAEAHEHWRPGRDCGACGAAACPAFRRRGGCVRRFLRAMGLVR